MSTWSGPVESEADRLLAYWRKHAAVSPWVPTKAEEAEMRATIRRCLLQAWGIIPRPSVGAPAFDGIQRFAADLPL